MEIENVVENEVEKVDTVQSNDSGHSFNSCHSHSCQSFKASSIFHPGWEKNQRYSHCYKYKLASYHLKNQKKTWVNTRLAYITIISETPNLLIIGPILAWSYDI